ncbi:MAG: glycosyltransferase family 4 protein [Magnetococcales bacterium]|nr:glycosyltransferase family 4 protein [Magnetococcales bacterium]
MNKPARILHLNPGGFRERGGMGRFLCYLIPAFEKRFADVAVNRAMDTYGPGDKKAMPFWFMLTWFKLVGTILMGRVDFVHIHMASYGSVLRKGVLVVTAWALRKPVLIHMHGGEFPAFIQPLSPRVLGLTKWMINRATRVVVLGEYWKTFFATEMDVPVEKITIIHNGVPEPEDRASLERRNDPPVMLFLGRVEVPKGVPELIAALARPEARNHPWKAIIAGEGDLDLYRAEVERAGLSDRIEFPGWIDHQGAIDLLRSSEIFVLPSHFECFSIAVLEAMTAGATVLTTPVGALPDAIIDGETGLMVPPKDDVALAEAVARLVTDAPLRQRLAKAAQERFYAMFTIDTTAERLADLYRELVAERER